MLAVSGATVASTAGRGGVAMIRRMILFGATGDLAGRFLLPALAVLAARCDLADDFLSDLRAAVAELSAAEHPVRPGPTAFHH